MGGVSQWVDRMNRIQEQERLAVERSIVVELTLFLEEERVAVLSWSHGELQILEAGKEIRNAVDYWKREGFREWVDGSVRETRLDNPEFLPRISLLVTRMFPEAFSKLKVFSNLKRNEEHEPPMGSKP
jgi:hypothetical protein